MTPVKKGRGALQITYLPARELKPHPKNSREHPPEQIDSIARSITAQANGGPLIQGVHRPIIINTKRQILAGHGTWMACRQLGLDEVPTITRAGLTVALERAYLIADNKIAEASTWNEGILAGELGELRAMGFDVSLTGFNQSEVEFMLAPTTPDPVEPPVPALQKRAVTRLGDVWQMDEHRLICGDSTKPETYKTLMAGRQAQCVFTDPPYGISYSAPSGQFEVIKNDDLRRGQLKQLLSGAFGAAFKHTREDAGWYVWHASGTREDFASAMRELGLVELCLIIWEKPGATLGWGDYRQAHEPCFYAARQGVKPAFYGDRTGTTLWRLEGAQPPGEPAAIGNGLIISTPAGEELYLTAKPPKGKKVRHLHLAPGTPLLLAATSDSADLWRVSRDAGHGKDAAIHPTMKPVELARRACRNSAKEGEIVLDLFAGASSTIMGAEQTRRIGYAIELDPHYVDAGVRRWQALTGKQATHAETKKPFEALERTRVKAA